MRRARRPGWLPTEPQELLLRAALDDRERALGAWAEWKDRKGADRSDGADLQILPLVAVNLERLDPDDPELGRLRGIRRFTWSKNQLPLKLGLEALRELERAGIETLVLKGGALSVLYYRDWGTRLLGDFDVLVPRESAVEAIAAVRRRLILREGFTRPEERVTVATGAHFGPEGEVDLHWYSLWQSAPDYDFWRAAVPIEIDGFPSKALCPPDQLLQVCVHGARWHAVPMLRWVADATLILRSNPDLDWDRFLGQGRRRELTATLAGALSYLREGPGAPVPAEVVEALCREPVSLAQRAARHAATHPPSLTGTLRTLWDRYRRLKRLDPASPAQPSFPAYLRAWSGSETYRRFSLYAARRMMARALAFTSALLGRRPQVR